MDSGDHVIQAFASYCSNFGNLFMFGELETSLTLIQKPQIHQFACVCPRSLVPLLPSTPLRSTLVEALKLQSAVLCYCRNMLCCVSFAYRVWLINPLTPDSINAFQIVYI